MTYLKDVNFHFYFENENGGVLSKDVCLGEEFTLTKLIDILYNTPNARLSKYLVSSTGKFHYAAIMPENLSEDDFNIERQNIVELFVNLSKIDEGALSLFFDHGEQLYQVQNIFDLEEFITLIHCDLITYLGRNMNEMAMNYFCKKEAITLESDENYEELFLKEVFNVDRENFFETEVGWYYVANVNE